MCKRDEVLPWTGLDEEPVGPFPAEPAFGSPEAVEQAAITIRAAAKAQTPGEQQALAELMLVVNEVVGEALARVRRERDQSRLDHECSEATLAMAVARLGGEVEGRPTHRGNFLQRIDELRRQEGELLAEVERLRAETLEEVHMRGEAEAEARHRGERWHVALGQLKGMTEQRDALTKALHGMLVVGGAEERRDAQAALKLAGGLP